MGIIETIKAYARVIQVVVFLLLIAALGTLSYIHRGTVRDLEDCRLQRDTAAAEVARLNNEGNNERETCGELRKSETTIDKKFNDIKEEISRSDKDETADGDISDYDIGRILCEQGLGDKKQCEALYPRVPSGKLPK